MPTRRKKSATSSKSVAFRQSVEPIIYPTPEKKNKLNYLLVGLLVIAAFVIGSMYTKLQMLEKNGGTQVGGNVGGNAAVPSGAPAAIVDVTVTDDDPSIGPKNAKVTVVTFEDFQCPFCGAFTGLDEAMVKNMQGRDPSWQPAVPGIKKEYVDSGKVRLVWKDYPFLGQESFWSGQAARCAQDQGKFWEFHDYLFSHQNGENQGAFSKDNLKKFALAIGLNANDFNNCIDSAKYEKKLQDAVTYGQSVGVSGTPATFVNGKMISGAAGFDTFKSEIEAALK
jgi:protein-disulfide isomerase